MKQCNRILRQARSDWQNRCQPLFVPRNCDYNENIDQRLSGLALLSQTNIQKPSPVHAPTPDLSKKIYFELPIYTKSQLLSKKISCIHATRCSGLKNKGQNLSVRKINSIHTTLEQQT